jgi:septation ring formation regulator EzrA
MRWHKAPGLGVAAAILRSWMMASPAERTTRALADVEADLFSAEKAFEDAQSRLKDAQRDLETALGRINQHQDELDQAVAALRERSPAGSRWKTATAGMDELLLSREMAPSAPGGPVGAHIENLSVHFDRLRAVAEDSSREQAGAEHGSQQTGAG